MSFPVDLERRMPRAEGEASYQWLRTACRLWILERTGHRTGSAPGPTIREPAWATVGTMAYVHGLEPLLHSLVRDAAGPIAGVPDELKDRWERTYYSTRLKNIEALHLLSSLLDQSRARGIPLLALKGPAAMADVYGDVGLRPMADLDILCPARDLPVVATIARSLGFSRAGTPYLHQLDFFRERDDMLLELHLNAHYCVRNKRRFLDSAWRDAMTASVEEWSFPVMSPEHQAVFELAHCVHDGFDVALKHVVDFAGRLILRGDALRYETLSALLEDAGLSETFALFAATLERLLDLPLAASARFRPGDRLDAFESAFLEQSRSIGFARRSRTGAGLLRERGVAKKALFTWNRLFPPLAALQAAYNLRSPVAAAMYVPVHVGRTAIETAGSWRSGV